MGVYVKLKKGDNFERVLKQFSKKVMNSGMYDELKKREHFLDARELKKFKEKIRRRRSKRRRR
jgi:ribosomal protein S21